MKYKLFENIRVGDIGKDYGGDKIVVIGKGSGRVGYDKLSQFDSTGACEEIVNDPASYGCNSIEKMLFVAAVHNYQTYLYLEDGVSIYKNQEL